VQANSPMPRFITTRCMANADGRWSGRVRPVMSVDCDGQKPPTPIPLTASFDTEDDSAFEDLETGLPWPPRGIAEGSVRVAPDDPALGEPLRPGEHALDDDSPAEQELDAFIEGRKRPHHLAD